MFFPLTTSTLNKISHLNGHVVIVHRILNGCTAPVVAEMKLKEWERRREGEDGDDDDVPSRKSLCDVAGV